LILQDQGRSARIVTAEGVSLFLRSSVIAPRRTVRAAVSGTGVGNIRTPIHGLTFHNSRADQEIASRFA